MDFGKKGKFGLAEYSRVISSIDRHFAKMVCNLAGEKASEELYIAASLISHLTTEGRQICLNLQDTENKQTLAEFFLQASNDLQDKEEKIIEALEKRPVPDNWEGKLLNSKVVAPAEEEKSPYKPLILDNHRLYLHRYWQYEQNLARLINKRYSLSKKKTPDIINSQRLEREIVGISARFDNNIKLKLKPDWQQTAVYVALSSPFSIITGGPGTGKTTVVSSILAILLQENPKIRVALCAPTGKAQARLLEALKVEMDQLRCSGDVRERLLNLQATTIHRLLGSSPGWPYFNHNAENQLNIDYLVVDEVSMVSLPLMAKLMEAVPDQAGILLLGDKDQLASVESGSVLADVCDFANYGQSFELFPIQREFLKNQSWPPGPLTSLNQSVVALTKSYRFSDNQGIGKLKDLVKAGEAEAALDLIQNDQTGEITYRPLPSSDNIYRALQKFLTHWNLKIPNLNKRIYFKDFYHLNSQKTGFEIMDQLDRAFGILDRFRILCTHRKGPFGSDNINRLVRLLLDKTRPYQHGLPLMITANNYALRLFNGDIGLCWYDKNMNLKVFFPNPDYRENTEISKYRSLFPAQLPEHETVFAMTIHKAQGSGFDNILMIFPSQDSRILTRELVYTGITRARNKVDLWTDLDILSSAIQRPTKRRSGLVEALNKL